jgi:hypothetical protein
MRLAAFSLVRWHFPHRSGTLRAKVGELGSFLLLVACLSWQSRQAGASGSFLACSVPWMLVL